MKTLSPLVHSPLILLTLGLHAADTIPKVNLYGGKGATDEIVVTAGK